MFQQQLASLKDAFKDMTAEREVRNGVATQWERALAGIQWEQAAQGIRSRIDRHDPLGVTMPQIGAASDAPMPLACSQRLRCWASARRRMPSGRMS